MKKIPLLFLGVNIWNNFNDDVKLASSIQSFKVKYKAHFIQRKLFLSIFSILSFIILPSYIFRKHDFIFSFSCRAH